MDKYEITSYECKTATIPDNNILLLQASDEKVLIDVCLGENYNVYHTKLANAAIQKLKSIKFKVVIAELGKTEADSFVPLIKEVFKSDQKIFFIVFSLTASKDAKTRYKCFTFKANMVTCCLNSVRHVLKQIFQINSSKGNLTCPYCSTDKLTEDGMWIHCPLYHINAENLSSVKTCMLCNKKALPNFGVHYRNAHGPCGRKEIHSEFDNNPIELYAFSLVVVFNKKLNQYLLVQEFCNSGFWLPGGRVDSGEELMEAAIRETKEEAGVDVKLMGVLSFQMTHSIGRLRVIFYAEPINEDQLPKSIPDYESVGASYVDASEIKDLPLRGKEPLIWVNYLEKGGTIYPLNIFSKE